MKDGVERGKIKVRMLINMVVEKLLITCGKTVDNKSLLKVLPKFAQSLVKTLLKLWPNSVFSLSKTIINIIIYNNMLSKI